MRYRLAETFYNQFLLWRSRNRWLNSRAPTTKASVSRRKLVYPTRGIKVALCGLLRPRRASLRGQVMASLGPPRAAFNAYAKRRKFVLMAATALAPLSLALSEPALAQTCTPVANPGNLTAAQPSTSCTGTFNTNINYGGPTTPQPPLLTLELQPGVSVINPGGNAVNLANTTGAINTIGTDATLTANNATITNITNSANNSALRIQTNGNATITASGPIEVSGTQSTNAIWAIVLPSSVPTVSKVVYDGPGVKATGTTFSTVIQAQNDGTGDSIIDARGNITGVALGSAANGITGLFASSGTGDNRLGSVHYRGGTIDVSGTFANGIFASGNSSTVITDPGTTIIVTSPAGDRLKPGVALDASGTAAAGNALTATVASTIQMLGPAAADPNLRNDGLGIRAFSFQDAPILVNYTGLGITTEGGNGIGIAALSVSGSVTVDSSLSGPITTKGSGAFGILADSGNILNNNNTIINNPILTPGGPITVTAPDVISTQGAEAHGIWAASTTGPVQINATNVSTNGQFSTAINAVSTGINGTGGSNVTVNIPSGGSVTGGWQVTLPALGRPSVYQLRALSWAQLAAPRP